MHKRRHHLIIDLRILAWRKFTLLNNAFNKVIARHNQLRLDLKFSLRKEDFVLLLWCHPHSPMPLTAVSHESQSKFIIAPKTWSVITRPQNLSRHDILHHWLHYGTRKAYPMMTTDNKASRLALLKPYEQKKGTRPNPIRSCNVHESYARRRSPVEPSKTRDQRNQWGHAASITPSWC
jgi:hypothetical protein